MTLSPLVNSPGDFLWKPKLEINVTPAIPQTTTVNASGVTRNIRLGTSILFVWELKFETSKSTYLDIDNFLRRHGYGALPFTWRYHARGITYTVQQESPVQFTMFSDNESDQNLQSVEFSLRIKRVPDIAGI